MLTQGQGGLNTGGADSIFIFKESARIYAYFDILSNQMICEELRAVLRNRAPGTG